MLTSRSIPARRVSQQRALLFFCLLFATALAAALAASSAYSNPASSSLEDALSAALCPVVYPDDQSPFAHGYHYTFFGNAFFINDQGYLLTVAHVLESFRNGGQPYILVDRRDAPPQLIKVSLIASDEQHDVAVLRATPNPFSHRYDVTFLPLASANPVRGQSVLALSLRPKRLAAAESFVREQEDTSPGTVLSYESTKLGTSGPPADVFLLSHPVVKGQSGSPVLDTGTHAAVGLVEGLWLRGAVLSKSSALPTNTPGAAIPIRYALALLSKNHVAWHAPEISSPKKSAQ